MAETIDNEVKRLQIVEKRVRRYAVRLIPKAMVPIIFMTLVAYFYPQTLIAQLAMGTDLICVFFIGIAVSTYYRGLEPENYAFRNIAKAIEVLDVSGGEAYSYVKDAYKILKRRALNKRIKWYKEANEILERFVENLQLIVLPAVDKYKVGMPIKGNLEEIALAITSMNLARVRKANEMLESSYERMKPEPSASTLKSFLTTTRESTIGKVLISLITGYSLILVICFLYALGTNQNFVTFLRDQPSIVILGGLGVSGITFWRTK
jgi:hypothetical protein